MIIQLTNIQLFISRLLTEIKHIWYYMFTKQYIKYRALLPTLVNFNSNLTFVLVFVNIILINPWPGVTIKTSFLQEPRLKLL